MAISDISKPTRAIRGPACETCATLARVDDKEAASLRKLLADPIWRYVELSDRLRDEGVDIPAASLGRHARGQCAAREKLR